MINIIQTPDILFQITRLCFHLGCVCLIRFILSIEHTISIVNDYNRMHRERH